MQQAIETALNSNPIDLVENIFMARSFEMERRSINE